MKWIITLAMLGCLAADDAARAQPVSLSETGQQAREHAERAYLDGKNDTGHRLLRKLIDDHPGEVDLAVACLNRIREEAGRNDAENPWVQYATRRLLALEQMGSISANSETVRTAARVHTKVLTEQGHRFELAEQADRLAAENPHDVFWRILQAQVALANDSAETRTLYARLRKEMDLDHPDEATRQRWHLISQELLADESQLPKPIDPLPEGSPLPLMELDDAVVRWQDVATRSPQQIPELVNRVAGQALMGERTLLWGDRSGFFDPARALDLHLLSQPRAELAGLRAVQAIAFAREKIPSNADASDILALCRKYPWALPAQRLLLKHANEDLLSGRLQAALRGFDEILKHADDAKLRDDARLGHWAVLAQMGQFDEIREAMERVDPQAKFTWLGKPATAAEIRAQLLSEQIEPQDTIAAPALDDLQLRIVRLPPVSPWPAEASSNRSSVDVQVSGDDLLVSGRNVLAMYDAQRTEKTVWTRLQRHAVGQENQSYHAGYFRPVIEDSRIFARWGFSSTPTGIAAYDRATGKPLWSNSQSPHSSPQRRREFHVPMGDPVLSDGLLYYLQWNSQENIQHNRGRVLSLVCYDPHERRPAWEHTIAEAGRASDVQASFERASPQSAIYGNQVTIRRGAVYSNSNAGVIARSDVRDGRTEWTHFYRQGGAMPGSLGAPPIVVGDRVICMPRDAGGRVFALDRRTGRLIWVNALVQGVEMVGMTDRGLIVRGQTSLAALDVETGQANWYRTLARRASGRTQLIGNSIYLARPDRLERLDAETGHLVESRSWNLNGDRPQNFAIASGNLYVITDKPVDGADGQLAQPLNPEAPESLALQLPLSRAWSLPRTAAAVSLPPAGSPLAGRAYLLSGGMLECVDVTPQGAVRWRRFVNASNPRINTFGKFVVIMDPGNARVPSAAGHLTALDGESGEVLWDVSLDAQLQHIMHCESHIVCHDGRGRVAGIELASGQLSWQRVLGTPQLMTVSWAAGRLHVVYVSGERVTWHLHVDPASGETIDHSRVEMGLKSGKTTNGHLVDGGYYEVTFEPTEARYIRLVCLSEINGRGWSSIAELHVVDADGENVPRSDWRILRADNTETKTAYDTRPITIFDNDPVTWWHTQWIGGIPNHPHEIHIDLGAKYKIKGMRYLPAVIINNNGMIRDYELYTSNDPNKWGEPSAKGYLVNRVRIERPVVASDAVYFEARNHQTQSWEVFRYDFDGQPARAVENRARIAGAGGPYLVVATEGKNTLTVLRSDDPDYRFEMTSEHPLHRDGEIKIDRDRLYLGRRSLVVADLAKRRYIVPPSPDNEKRNRNGFLARAGEHHLLKFVNLGAEGQGVYMIDMTNGEMTEGKLPDQSDPLRELLSNQTLAHYGQVVLLSDGFSVTAWVAGD